MNLLARFFRNPVRCGALCPSSPKLCRAMTRNLGIETARCVAELGPGTGAITGEIVKLARPDATVAAVELDPLLCARLREKFPGAVVFNDSAANLHTLLAGRGIPEADVVISGLPWAHFPEKTQRAILDSVLAALAPDGVFATFAYCSGFLLPGSYSFRRLLKNLFPRVRTSPWIFRNLPPSFVYYCAKSNAANLP